MNGKQVKRALSLLALSLLMLGAVSAQDSEGTTVMLGTSGASVTLTMSDGKYSVTASDMVTSIVVGPDGTPQGALAANGNMYTLSMDADGNWMANFMAPDPVSVTLGSSGDSVSVQMAEDGSYMMNGMAVADGDMVAAANGNMYMLSMANGMWSATYVPAEASVTLGITGEMVTVMTAEDGTYWIGDMELMDGSTTMASNGNTYSLSMGDDGTWMATYMAPAAATVDLGTSGASVTFRKNENGTYSPVGMNGVAGYSDADGARVVTATNGNSYTLTVDADGMWMASYNMPAAQSVMLGTSGASVDVTKAENGTYWIGTDELMDGDTRVAGNNTYQLSMTDGMWMATYVPAMTMVALGTSGDSAELMRAEDGSYWLGEMAVMDGTTTMASNGNTYSLSMGDDGSWMATFVAPDPISLALGKSGDTVSITMNEARMYMIGEMEIMDGSTYTSAAGNNYTLMMDDAGMWSAMYNGEETMVALGTSGSSATLVKQEDGTYAMDGKAFESGMTATAENGMVYVLSMDADGMWMASYVTNSQTVTLGISGDVTLTQAEDGSWWDGETAVMSGSELTAENGNKYVLSQDSEGTFTATYQPVTMEILGTGLVAAEKEDGTGYNVGDAMLDHTATGDITVDGAMYHVWLDGETMKGARYDKAIVEDTEFAIGVLSDVVDTTAPIDTLDDDEDVEGLKLLADDPDTVGNETRTALQLSFANTASTDDPPVATGIADGLVNYSMSDLLGSGSATNSGKNIVQKALEGVEKQRARVKALSTVLTEDTDTATIIAELSKAENAVEDLIQEIFGSTAYPTDTLEIDDDNFSDALGDLDAIVLALSTLQGFQRATAADGGGVFEDLELSADKAAEAFDATPRESMVALGVTGDTRYGAGWQKSRSHATAALGNAAFGAFAYATVAETLRTAHILNETGTANYQGGTRAADSTGELYAGDIALKIRFASRTVNALVSNLANIEDGSPWNYRFGDVVSITLPTATMRATQPRWEAVTGTGDNQTAGGNASVAYSLQAGSPAPQLIAGSAFAGRLLGVGDDAGSQAVGVWSVGTDLYGAFGAARTADTTESRPTTDAGGKIESKVVAPSSAADHYNITLADGKLTLDKAVAEDDSTTAIEQRVAATSDKWVIDLEQEIGRQGAERTLKAGTYVDAARKEIIKQRTRLAALQQVDTSKQVGTAEDAAWIAVMTELDTKVFGDGNTGSDPIKSLTTRGDSADNSAIKDPYGHTGLGTADRKPKRDGERLSTLDDIIDALSSESKLTDALKDGGVFDDVNPNRTAAQIYAVQSSQVKLWMGSTDYTRFGVWREQRWSHGEDSSVANQAALADNIANAFAYSPLQPTYFSSDEDPSYPGRRRRSDG